MAEVEEMGVSEQAPVQPLVKRRIRLRDLVDLKWFIGLLAGLAVATVVPYSLYLAYPVLAWYALRGPVQTIQALLLLFLVMLPNSAVSGTANNNLRYVVFLAAFLQVILHAQRVKDRRMTGVLNALFLLVFILLLNALVFSAIPSLSLLKAVSFFLVAYAILKSFQASREFGWERWLQTYFCFILAGSFGFLVVGYGFTKNGVGFQGILSHPQVAGTAFAACAIWFSVHVLHKGTFRYAELVAALLGWGFTYLSGSRTALLAALLGFAGAFVFLFLQGKGIKQYPWLQRYGVLFGLFGLIGLLFLPGQVSQLMNEFVDKGGEVGGITEAFEESRGNLIRESMDTFRENQIGGIGFGLSEDSLDPVYQKYRIKRIWGIPVSASVEKGFLPSAVLEETGILGAFGVALLIGAMVISVIRSGELLGMWLLFTCLLTNAGEAAFLSMGGIGLFLMLMTGLALTYRPPKDA